MGHQESSSLPPEATIEKDYTENPFGGFFWFLFDGSKKSFAMATIPSNSDIAGLISQIERTTSNVPQDVELRQSLYDATRKLNLALESPGTHSNGWFTWQVS